eukprot:TRINITY_DN12056_c0_g1_i2.p1 TRINITY_DN12056_c0_g1~~TRINITY_DN12056_c0_g1_i2.p1  ORF type:complete len:521 (+),score=45.50 TRINITY_DN12056_c0_g1_i2:78-1640(+)
MAGIATALANASCLLRGGVTAELCCDRVPGARKCPESLYTFSLCSGVHGTRGFASDSTYIGKELCCQLRFGPESAQRCWNGALSFGTCCGGGTLTEFTEEKKDDHEFAQRSLLMAVACIDGAAICGGQGPLSVYSLVEIVSSPLIVAVVAGTDNFVGRGASGTSSADSVTFPLLQRWGRCGRRWGSPWARRLVQTLAQEMLEMLTRLLNILSDYHEDVLVEARPGVEAILSARAQQDTRASVKPRPNVGAPFKVVYIAGVEGTGHAGVNPWLLYAHMLDEGSAVGLQWYKCLMQTFVWTPRPYRRGGVALLVAVTYQFVLSCRVVLVGFSYPFGIEHRDRFVLGSQDAEAVRKEELSGSPGNSVDLREFVELFQEHAEVKVLALHRQLTSATWSHREHDADIVRHARVLAMFNAYLTGALATLDPRIWRWVAYETLSDAHGNQTRFRALVRHAADFLDVTEGSVRRSFRYFRCSRKNARLEMGASDYSAVMDLESASQDMWFPTKFPHQSLVPFEGPLIR